MPERSRGRLVAAARRAPEEDDAEWSRTVAVLLEDGSAVELRWLVRQRPEAWLRRWVEEHGQRRLSRRSRAFWSRILGIRLSEAPPAARALWPLA